LVVVQGQQEQAVLLAVLEEAEALVQEGRLPLVQTRAAMAVALTLLIQLLLTVTRWVVVGARAAMSMLPETMPNTAEEAAEEAGRVVLSVRQAVHQYSPQAQEQAEATLLEAKMVE
jgi:hypothetical protein